MSAVHSVVSVSPAYLLGNLILPDLNRFLQRLTMSCYDLEHQVSAATCSSTICKFTFLLNFLAPRQGYRKNIL